MILLASNYGLVCLLLRQFKPLYILANSAIFSVAVFTYMIDARGAAFEVGLLTTTTKAPLPTPKPTPTPTTRYRLLRTLPLLKHHTQDHREGI